MFLFFFDYVEFQKLQAEGFCGAGVVLVNAYAFTFGDAYYIIRLDGFDACIPFLKESVLLASLWHVFQLPGTLAGSIVPWSTMVSLANQLIDSLTV